MDLELPGSDLDMDVTDTSGFGDSSVRKQTDGKMTKRKIETPTSNEKGTTSKEALVSRNTDLGAGLECIHSSLKQAISETKIMKSCNVQGSGHVVNILEEMLKNLRGLLKANKNGQYGSQSPTGSPTTKRTKMLDAQGLPISTFKVTKDAATDTILTPSWWDSDKLWNAKRKSKKTANALLPTGPETELDSAMETDTETWSRVAGKRKKKC